MQHSHLFVNSLVVTIFSDFPLPLADPLLPLLQALGLLPLEVLDHLENEGVLGQDPEHVDDAGHHPGLHRGQALRLYWSFAELFARQIIFARHCYVDICYYPVSCVTAMNFN